MEVKEMMKRGSILGLMIVVASLLINLVAKADDTDVTQIYYTTEFTSKENQSDHIDPIIKIYYCIYAVNLYEEGQTVAGLLDLLDKLHVYPLSMNQSESHVIFQFTDNLELRIDNDPKGVIEQETVIVTCPIHGVCYQFPVDLDYSFENIENSHADYINFKNRHYSVIREGVSEDQLHACLTEEHTFESAAEYTLFESIRIIIRSLLNGLDYPQIRDGDTLLNGTDNPWIKEKDLLIQEEDKGVTIAWRLLPKNAQRFQDAYIYCSIHISPDTNEIQHIMIVQNPPLLPDLFESPYVYDKTYRDINIQGPIITSMTGNPLLEIGLIFQGEISVIGFSDE